MRVLPYLALLALPLLARAEPLAMRMLANEHLREWQTVKQSVEETVLHQEWKQTVLGTPKGAEASRAVTYHAERMDTAEAARGAAAFMLEKRRLSGYASQGFTVTSAPWLGVTEGAVFTVEGTRYSVEGNRHVRAELYTLAVARDAWVMWLEVRRVASGADVKGLGKAFKAADVSREAADLSHMLLGVWAAAPEAVVAPVNPIAPPVTPANPPTLPASPTTPATPPTPVDPPAPGRWQTPDGGLSIPLPAGWAVRGDGPFDIVGLPGVDIRLFPADAYRTDADRDRLIEEFAATQQAVSLRGFVRRPATTGGATGVMVSYVNYDKRTTHAWYVARNNRLWRLDVDLPGLDAALPAEITALVAGMEMR